MWDKFAEQAAAQEQKLARQQAEEQRVSV
jgi:hypothetical protein